jgi:comEA protein
MKKGFDFNQFLEKYRLWIGGGLLLAIIAGGAILLWRENYWKPSLEDRISQYEDKISSLEDKIDNINNSNTKVTPQAEVNTAPDESGSVAGIDTEPTPIPKSSQTISGKININTASASQLDTLSGIGPAYAGRIIDYRVANGGFKTIEEIQNVKGIGPKTFEKIKDNITVN